MNIEHYKALLKALRMETQHVLEQTSDATRTVELDQTIMGRLSRMDAMQQQEMALSAKRRYENLLNQIDQAFERLTKGDYGYCALCDEEISEKRLELNPVVLTCFDCTE